MHFSSTCFFFNWRFSPLSRTFRLEIAIYYSLSIWQFWNPFSSYFISYHTISYHIISYHIISYYVISYHIIYHIMSSFCSFQLNWSEREGYQRLSLFFRVSTHNKVRPPQREPCSLFFSNSAWVLLRLFKNYEQWRVARRNLRLVALILED